MTKIDLGQLFQINKNKQQMLAHSATERYILYGRAKGGGKTAWEINEPLQRYSVTADMQLHFEGLTKKVYFWRYKVTI